MRIFEIIRIALLSIKENKLRSSLTILGIVIGIFSIISISTVIAMLQNSINVGLSQLGQNTFQIQKYPAIRTGRLDKSIRNRKNITYSEYKRFAKLLTVAKYTGAEQWHYGKKITSKWAFTKSDVQIGGVTADAIKTNDWELSSGRPFNQNDINFATKTCIIGEDVRKKIFRYTNPLGQEIRVDGLRLKVIGIIKERGQIFGNSRDNNLILPLTTLQGYYGKYTRTVNITVTAPSKILYNQTIEAAIGAMRIIRKVPAGIDNTFSIYSNDSLIEQIGDITKYVRIGAIIIACIALLAAGIGIMNIMLVSVTERTREIGIRKAVGAKKKNILFQFLIESITLCQVGGVIGIVLGVGVGNIAGSLLKADPIIPVFWIITGVSLCVFIGVLFGTYPAYKASKLDPIKALSYE